jgi:hypothetical protein
VEMFLQSLIRFDGFKIIKQKDVLIFYILKEDEKKEETKKEVIIKFLNKNAVFTSPVW